MSVVKVPIFGGLVTNADPEDLKKELTPLTHNFDISKTGVLKRREIATKIKQLEDRGFSSMFLWSNDSLGTGNGAEWLIYCNQRGIIYRMDRFYNDLFLDSYDNNIAQVDAGASPPRDNKFLHFIGNNLEVIPKTISFMPFGDFVLIGMGHRFEPKIVSAVIQRQMFGNLYTKPTGVYIEDFHRGLPTTFTLSSSTDTNVGTLADGNYTYALAPIYDGVNEIPISPESFVNKAITGGSGASIKLTIGMNTNDLPCSMTGLRIYRSLLPANSNSKKSFRKIKTVNFLTPSGQDDASINAPIVGGRHLIYSNEGFPKPQAWVNAWNNKFPDNTKTQQQLMSASYKWVVYMAGAETDEWGSSNTDFTKKTDQLTNAEYWVGSAITSGSQSATSFNGMNFWSDRLALDNDNHLLNMGTMEVLQDGRNSNPESDDFGADNDWTEIGGTPVVLRLFKVSDQSVDVYLGVENCYMGANKLFFPNNKVFKEANSHAGKVFDLTFTDYAGSSQTVNQGILANDRKMLMTDLGSDTTVNALVSAFTSDHTITNPGASTSGSTNLCLHNTGTFDHTGELDFSYNATSKAITLVFNDLGIADGSLPPVPRSTKTNLRWKYSMNHGGRMFVANVLIDPDGLNEYYDDMICYSELGMPGIIPISNYIRLRDTDGGAITGMVSMGDSLMLFMENGLFRLRVPSLDPASFQVMEANEHIGSIAPKSIIKVEEDVYFCGKGNIYRINNRFTITPIGDAIFDKWAEQAEKEKTIAEYDPIKQVVVFRFGRVKQDAYEYTIRTGEWNKIQTQGNISSMAIGEGGHLYFGDNAYLDVTRSDGNDNDEDPPDLPDDPTDPDIGINLYDNNFDTTAVIVAEQNTNTAGFSTPFYKNMLFTQGGVYGRATDTSMLNVGMEVTCSDFFPEGTTITANDTSANPNTITLSNASSGGDNVTPMSAWFFGHNPSSNTFYGQRIYNSSSIVDNYEYFLNDDDFTNTNTKLSDGYFADEHYVFVKVIADNMQVNSLSLTRKVVYSQLLRIDPTAYGSSPQELKFTKVYAEDVYPPAPVLVYFFQDQLNRDSDAYTYASGEFQGMGSEANNNQSILVLKWKNSSYAQQPMLKHNQTHGYFLQLRDVYNYRIWDDIKPDTNTDEDDGDNSGNFTAPTIQTVNTSTATADTNGSGDNLVHFPYWSRLADHSSDFSFSNNSTTMITAMGASPVKARYMGEFETNLHKFNSNIAYKCEGFIIYEQDANTTSSFRQWRPVKNTANSAYYADVSYGWVWRLIEIDGSDDTYQSSILTPYSATESLMVTTAYGYDPLEQEPVELIDYYLNTANIQPEQSIVPMAGWLENGVEQ